MELNIDKGRRKSFDIECVEVTDENLAAVATWCKGKVLEHEGTKYVDVSASDKNAMNSRQTKGFAGDFIVRHVELNTFKSFSQKAFDKAYEITETRKVHKSSVDGKFVSDEVAAADPEHVVAQTVTYTQKGTGHQATIPANELTETEKEADKNAALGVDPKLLGDPLDPFQLPRDADPS